MREMNRVLGIILLCLLPFVSGCKTDRDIPADDLLRTSSVFKTVYGAPDSVEAEVPVAWALPTEVTAKDSLLLDAMSPVGLGITSALVNSSSWEEGTVNIKSFLDDPTTPDELIDKHILDQMIAQNMIYFTDILSSPGSVERTSALRSILDTFIDNRFPYPERVESVISALGVELDPSEASAAAAAALSAHENMSTGIESLRDTCEPCFDALVHGETEEEVEIRNTAISRLTSLAELRQR